MIRARAAAQSADASGSVIGSGFRLNTGRREQDWPRDAADALPTCEGIWVRVGPAMKQPAGGPLIRLIAGRLAAPLAPAILAEVVRVVPEKFILVALRFAARFSELFTEVLGALSF
jgi:hypothetical protein